MEIGKYKVKRRSVDIETHEVFLDDLAREKEEDMGITGKRLEVPLGEKLIYFIFGFFILCLVILFARLFYFQVVLGSDFSLASQSNKTRSIFSPAERGVIYDRNMKQLVFNQPSFDLLVDKRDLVNTDSASEINRAADILGIAPFEIEAKIEESVDSEILIYENLPHELLVVFEAQMPSFIAFRIEKTTLRQYNNAEYLAHVLGYMGKVSKEDLKYGYSFNDYIGKSGVERSYENILRGVPGRIDVEKDALGNKEGERTVSSPISGQSQVLNIDLGLQKKLTDVLKKRLESMNLKKAAAVAIDPKTGGVLALVSLPSFDSNIFGLGDKGQLSSIFSNKDQPLFNRAISGQYPPGSIIKPFIASAALEEGIISPDKEIYDLGYIEVKSKYDPNIVYRYNGLEAPGYYDMRKAISKSSNIYFYTIGGGFGDQKGLGPANIKQYLELFGLGSYLDVDLPGEADGFVPSPEWKKEVKNE
ncbi:hypothetical protein KKG36_01050, partial [Patescibacteria group bacterium]|nr:hypothetical protein [Patescibacteria group bacterium]